MKEKFVEWQPSASSRALLHEINSILSSYDIQGYTLTLRQLYYQLVAADKIPNKVQEYKKLGNIVSRGRLAGLIDWRMIEDRVRVPAVNTHWSSPESIIKSAAGGYLIEKWTDNQQYYVEVWAEKDAVSNIIEPICSKWDVLFMANRGYSSQSAMYDAHNRLIERCQDLQAEPAILYFGDHDPSGLDMDNDIKRRLDIFADYQYNVIFERVALTMEQIEEYDPPENPAKVTDSRFNRYVQSHGPASWELDALKPQVLAELVETSILRYTDVEAWNERQELEDQEKEVLKKISENYEQVVEFAEGLE